MKIIITGATGAYGKGVTSGLLERVPAKDLILITRNPDKLKAMQDLGADVRFGDFDDKASMVKACAGGERMLMISGTRVGLRMPQHTNAVTAAAEAGVKHLVYTSFIGAVPSNSSLAVSDHRGTEALLQKTPITWTALRSGHYADFILAAGPNAMASGKWVSSAESGSLAQVTKQDCINCAVEVLLTEGHENKVYNITGPEFNTMEDVCNIVSDVSGYPIEYVNVTDDDMYAYFDSLGVSRAPIDDHVASGVPWCSDDMVSFERAIREGDFHIISDDVETLTGNKPKGLRQFAEENKAGLILPSDTIQS